jgi:radical SAM-linked protein
MAKAQRLRVTFSRDEGVKYITHLDLMRLWERALRRAGVDLSYSEGYKPRPRLSLGAPLAVGVTSSGELMDVYLSSRMRPLDFIREVSEQLPEGVSVRETHEVGVALPSLQSEVRWAEYRVDLDAGVSAQDASSAVETFLAAESMPWEHARDKEVRRYDIRALVQDIWLEEGPQEATGPRLGMRLRADSGGSGRPEQVTAALGLGEPLAIHRTKLILADTSPTHRAWRRRGTYEI